MRPKFGDGGCVPSPEDIVRERERAKARAETSAREQSQLRVEEGRRREVYEIRRDAGAVLAALADRDYPDGVMLRVFSRMTFFGREKYIERAAWGVCGYRYEMHGEEVGGKVHLLSDGAFTFSPRGMLAILDLDEVVAAPRRNVFPTLGAISNGLRELLVRYS